MADERRVDRDELCRGNDASTHNNGVEEVVRLSPPEAGAVVLGANMFPDAWNVGLLCDG